MQCSEMHLATENVDHQNTPKPKMIVSLDPMNLRKTCCVTSEAINVFSDGITEIDGSGEHKS